MRLYYFNPETEMALAAGSGVYTPPRKVAEAKKRLGLLPVVYAEPGSAILVDPGAEVYP